MSARTTAPARRVFCIFKQSTAYDLRISDWSSDVCSSDRPARCPFLRREVPGPLDVCGEGEPLPGSPRDPVGQDRKSVVQGKSVSVRVDLGGRRIIKKKTKFLTESL